MPLDTDIGKDRASQRPDAFDNADCAHNADELATLEHAVNGLTRGRPELSAKTLLWPWQSVALGIAALAIVFAIIVSPQGTATAAFGLLALPFLCVVILRLAALRELAAGPRHAEAMDVCDADLPTYAVLVPLFREAQTVPGLVQALARIDYPQHLLEISLIAEEIDHDTRAALAGAKLSAAMRIVVVPDGAPRTKPRALNYALASATGEIVVVFDAEDAPEPDQLRRAAAVFRSSNCAQYRGPEASRQPAPHGSIKFGPNKHTRPLACVQARLNIYNRHDSWLSRGILAQTPQAIR